MDAAVEITETLERSEEMDRMRENALLNCRAIQRGWLTPEEVKTAREGLVDFLWYLKSSYNERDVALRKLLKDEEDLPNGLPTPISDLKDGTQGPSKTHMLLYLCLKVPGLTNEGYAAIMNPSFLDLPAGHRGRKAYISLISSSSAQLREDSTKETTKSLLEKTPDTAHKSRFFRTRPRPEVLRGAEPWQPDPLLFPSSRGEGAAPQLAPLSMEEPPPPVPRDPLSSAFRGAAEDIDAILDGLVKDEKPPSEAKKTWVGPGTMRHTTREEAHFQSYGDPDQYPSLVKPTPDPEPEEASPTVGRLIEKHRTKQEALSTDLDEIGALIEQTEGQIRILREKQSHLLQEFEEVSTLIAALTSYRG